MAHWKKQCIKEAIDGTGSKEATVKNQCIKEAMAEKGGRVPPAACLVLPCPLCCFFFPPNCSSLFCELETFVQNKIL